MAQAGAVNPPVEKDYAKLITLGVLHMAQFFPAAFAGVALPFIFREQGLPIEMFWLLALPAVPRWLKWLIAMLVDNYGNARIGFRKSWIIPCTLIGTACYAALAWIPPTVAALYSIVSILVFKSFVMAAQDTAVDGFAAESMTDAERPVGTSIIVFLALVAQVFGAGAVAIVEQFGWSTTMFMASLLMLLAALPAILRPEPPPPVESLERRERGERASILKTLRRPESRWILPFLFGFGFGANAVISMMGPFFADKGLSLTQFGTLAVVCFITGSALGAVVTPALIRRFGMKLTALAGLSVLPFEAVAYYSFAAMDGLPAMPVLMAAMSAIFFGNAIYIFVVSNSRFRWASKQQAGTDYSAQSSVWNFGQWAAGSAAGFAVQAIGWSYFFPIAATLTFAFGLFYVLSFDRIETMVLAREATESAPS
ncbi:MAG: MFS transporter [Deltaproteobacteria bacterium]|nr:MFS transporter [Deltaproteobacteria bacterium]